MGSKRGSERAAASRLGLSLKQYLRKCYRHKWCTACKAWHLKSAFGEDISRGDGLTSMCLAGKAQHQRKFYIPRPPSRKSRGLPPRDGDKAQARRSINTAIRWGKMPHPNSLPCVDCGHVWAQGSARRHEYDHTNGYGALFHRVVEVVCQGCHLIREGERLKRLP